MNEIGTQTAFQETHAPDEWRPESFGARARASLDTCTAALGTGSRIIYAAIPSTEDLRKKTLNLSIVLGVLLAIGLVTKASFKSYVTIDSITVPKSVMDRGLSGDVIAQRILDEMNDIGRTSKVKQALGEFSTFSFDRALPKVDLQFGGMSLGTVVGALRDFMGLVDTKIGGEVVVDDDAADGKKKYSLRLRISDRGAVYRTTDPSDNLDTLIRASAMQVVERFDPHVAAAFYYATDDYANASQMVHAALSDQTAGNDAEALNLRGMLLQKQGRFDEALAQFRYVRLRFPQYVEAQHNVAATLIMQYRYPEALTEARVGIELDPKRIQGYLNAGSALYSDLKYDEALDYFAKAAAVGPTEATGYLTQASVYRNRPQPDYDKAIALYRRAADADPRDARVFINWGSLMRKLNDRAQARVLFARAIDAAPKSPDGYDELGVTLLDDRQWDKAAEQFQKAIKINPKEAMYQDHLARAMRETGSLDQVVKAPQ